MMRRLPLPHHCTFLCLAVLLLCLLRPTAAADVVEEGEPRFVAPIENVTVSVGRDAKLSCVVENLHDYKVAWMYKRKSERTVLTVATQVITKNPRVSAVQEAQAWVLTINQVKKENQGVYMCQINTKPIQKQLGYLHVVVPPVIDDETSSGDVIVDEGEDVMMTCDARGDPHPVIRWVRERSANISLNSSMVVNEYQGRSLALESVSRNSTGAYLCIASNGVPPSVSKRLLLTVNFPPKILPRRSSSQVGVPLEGTAKLSCRFQARPVQDVRWYKGPRELKSHEPGITIKTSREELNGDVVTTTLIVQMHRARDFG
ncbi:neurotrimin-like, partial [Macrobrachium nipponense]|uniref:neurotrimin-like n=1 Tax=Macrobrachium nipponense TaxID=159736 RepID=UPI0030C89FCF